MTNERAWRAKGGLIAGLLWTSPLGYALYDGDAL